MFDVLFQPAIDGQLYIQWLLSGLMWTLLLAVGGWWIAFAIGVLVGVGRTSRNRAVALAARLYVEVFRNIPVLVQMFLWYFVLPELLPTGLGDRIKQMPPPWGAFFPALACLGLYTAARIAEQVRAGIEALPAGQDEAAAALGLSPWAARRHIIVPQALRLIVPSLTSEVMGIYKNTSVALTIGLLELTAQARQISEATFQTFGAFAAATIIYLLLALVAYRLMLWIDRRFQIPGSAPARKARRLPILRRGGAL
ncbi:amino acid ABC transporter permease [Paracoccus denitrificans]|jgi:glutamate/aspartate transport system permease protein|uniref:L-glutamate ABC transporter membrane protein / L-aspartate ABC transporter membrane protein n=1 Tax=Paracoccus denitrificans (strain Pd 1222) TaxID=318586 RepID=A1B0Y8_PARDP|nr:amino acid ABC transporter permease [Paracoccus denitrificans]ABL69182.1 L-glutamate ABC transporter membrane protein / L-aspartate ABC transporter membrane protein [Paracoccus denitrificans PD1222]MBB4629014.1 glutamate/aspartate transport system permease protein [Paracoccus denitrificans]MCU7430039.1 amino acid ABC transporter permease [Paracoccus denitrificans]QAR27197.1 amino acid ABC transporter permease [Paracoccus denitrificans]UPV96166.1 amino acid ABC transporter permease [Paracocc